MTASKRAFLLLATGSILLFSILIVWGMGRKGSQPSVPEVVGTSTPETTVEGVTGTGQYTVEEVKPTSVTPPALKEIYISDSYPKDAAVILRQKIEAEYAALRKEPTRVDLWLELGVYRKMGDDFQGAIEAWQYVAKAAPRETQAIAYGNLGNLYLYFLKEYALSETNYNKAIALNPHVPSYYVTLYYLYRDIYKDPAKEADILARGLAANPGDSDLLGFKAELASSTKAK